MQVGGKLPNYRTYAVLLNGLCKSGQLEEAMGLFQDMIDKKLPLNVVIYTILIEAMFEAGDLEAAKDLSQLIIKRLAPECANTHNNDRWIF